MANTRNMIQLMQHAAYLLDACQPMLNAREVGRCSPSTVDRDAAFEHAAQEIAAIATASAVLAMVANAMDDDPAESVIAAKALLAAADEVDRPELEGQFWAGWLRDRAVRIEREASHA